MRKIFTLSLLSLCALLYGSSLQAQQLKTIERISDVTLPFIYLSDSTSVSHKSFDEAEVLTTDFCLPNDINATTLKADTEGYFHPAVNKKGRGQLTTYRFVISASRYAKGHLKITGQGRFALYKGNKKVADRSATSPKDSLAIDHEVALDAGSQDYYLRTLILHQDSVKQQFAIRIEPSDSSVQAITLSAEVAKKRLTAEHIFNGLFLSSSAYSPSGEYLLVRYRYTQGNKNDSYGKIYDAKGRIIRQDKELAKCHWMPESDELYFVRSINEKRNLYKSLPDGSKETLLLEGIPENDPFFMKRNDLLLVGIKEEGDKKDEKVQYVRDPDDRMPGWRNGYTIAIIDLQSGDRLPLTFGKKQVTPIDIDAQGRFLLQSGNTDWKNAPNINTADYILFDALTGKKDTLIRKGIDLSEAQFTPDGQHIIFKGSPNSFDGVGNAIGRPANGFEGELFLFDIATRKASPLTKNFNPSVTHFSLDKKGNLYMLVEEGSRRKLYLIDAKGGHYTAAPRMLTRAEEYIQNFSFSDHGQVAYIGQSATNGPRLYTVAKGKEKCLWDLDAERNKGYERPIVKDFGFSYNGTPIEAWYILPPDFDASKKYPLLVYYYGGTSPTNRYMEGTWSLPMFAAQGYVMLTLNPSGTTGYGQDFSARHLNAWGEPTAEEIIACVKSFTEKHPFIDAKKIGCFGASYGGFMTQYLLTKTDIFAAGVSHAGISSISNYWGSGFWGVGYNTVAAHGNYPWSNPKLYVGQSPLFRVENIHTPLLLLHGDSDTNVPTGESINMYNALKVLGKEVALIKFTGQDHFILEYDRRMQWLESMWGWFDKYLKGDPSRWEALYGKEEK